MGFNKELRNSKQTSESNKISSFGVLNCEYAAFETNEFELVLNVVIVPGSSDTFSAGLSDMFNN